MEIILKYFIESFIAIISALLLYYYKKIKTVLKTVEINRLSILLLIKNFIIEKYFSIINKNCITIEEKEIILELYREYKKLGGNDIVDNLIININSIPLKEKCEEA